MPNITDGLNLFDNAQVVLFIGPRGNGKTEIAANIAINGKGEVVVVDLDVYKPYIRTRDIAPVYGYPARYPEGDLKYMDSPVIPGGISDLLEEGKKIIFDLAGEETGTCPIGIYRDDIRKVPFKTVLVVNPFRANFTYEGLLTYMNTFNNKLEADFAISEVIPNINLAGALTADDFFAGYNKFKETVAKLERQLAIPFIATEAEVAPVVADKVEYPVLPIQRHIFV
jgi:hypothetical protein